MSKNKNILVPLDPTKLGYSYPGSAREPKRDYPTRSSRAAHGRGLLNNLNTLNSEIDEQVSNRASVVDADASGVFVEVKGESNFELKLDSLEDVRSGIEVVSTRVNEDLSRTAIVYIPDGQASKLVKKIEDYLDTSKDTKNGNPKNAPLVNSISEFKLALLESFWVDQKEDYPDDENDEVYWEVWILKKRNAHNRFLYFCDLYKIERKDYVLEIGDRVIFIVKTTAQKLSNIFNYDCPLGELRKITSTSLPIIESSKIDQAEWAESLLKRVKRENKNVEIWLLDTGVNLTNPLLEGQIASDKNLAVNESWGSHDHHPHGHGTQMAGLALYGDLLNKLMSDEDVEIKHDVCGIKIVPNVGSNTEESYPHITYEAVSIATVKSPDTEKIFNLTVTDIDPSRAGSGNTTWSAAIDNICYQDKCNFLISVGNIRNSQDLFKYPDINLLNKAEDPAQASNAIAVGAFTEKYKVEEDDFTGWSPLAELGGLAPTSRTSRNWESFLPYKPDIVMEGGNRAISPDKTEIVDPDSLQILTTAPVPQEGVFTVTKDTSPAATLASNFLARLQSEFTDYWPETIRALTVHSSTWTEKMLAHFHPYQVKENVKSLIKCYGYGVPSFEKAVYCEQNELTLVYQGIMQPYHLDGSSVKFNEMHLHELPWPKEELEKLGEVEVNLKITLSYFIEPNPPKRGWIKKYGYVSHGLRFKMKTSTETLDNFKSRISKDFREDGESYGGSDSDNWFLGIQNRSKGSLHSDTWTGTAAELAQKDYIIVHPTKGWWADLKSREAYNNKARYSLVVSIDAPGVEVDIYNVVKTKIENLVANKIENLL